MVKLLFLVLIIFSSDVSAEWVLHHQTQSGTEFWYYDKLIRKTGDTVWVWQRMKFATANRNGFKSIKAYVQINCDEYTYQNLSDTFYKDQNWTEEDHTNTNHTEKQDIYPNSVLEHLADIVCKQ